MLWIQSSSPSVIWSITSCWVRPDFLSTLNWRSACGDHAQQGGRADAHERLSQSSTSQVASRSPCTNSAGDTIRNSCSGCGSSGFPGWMERVGHQEQAVDAHARGREVGRDLAAEPDAAQEQVGGGRGGIAAERTQRGAHRAAQPGRASGLRLPASANGKLKRSAEVAPLGERAVQALDRLAGSCRRGRRARSRPRPASRSATSAGRRGRPEAASNPWMGSESGILISS